MDISTQTEISPKGIWASPPPQGREKKKKTGRGGWEVHIIDVFHSVPAVMNNLIHLQVHYRVSYSWLLFSNQTHPEGIISRPDLGMLSLRPLITRSGCVFGQDTRGRSKPFPECLEGMTAEKSPLVLPDAFCSGLPAVTSHPQAPRIPSPDHTLVSLRHRKLTQVQR